jgi:hypothetical protein
MVWQVRELGSQGGLRRVPEALLEAIELVWRGWHCFLCPAACTQDAGRASRLSSSFTPSAHGSDAQHTAPLCSPAPA